MTTTVQEFIKDKPPVEKTTVDDSLIAAVKRMIGDDYSQLPVIDSNNCPIGLITSESVLKALNNFATTLESVRIKHAMLKKPQIFNQNIDLLDLFEEMTGNVALVVDDENKLVQIITDFDTAQYFRQRAQDIILVENIENLLKDFVQLAFSSDSDGEARLELLIHTMTDSSFAIRQKFEKGMRSYLGSERIKFDDALFDQVFERQLFEEGVHSYLKLLPKDKQVSFDNALFNQVFEKYLANKQLLPKFDDLSLGHYISLFLHRDYWHHYEGIFELEKASISNLLESVRKTRNDLSHFREISRDQSIQLRDCYDLLNNHQEAINNALTPYEIETEDELTFRETEDVTITHPIDDEPVSGDSRYAPLAIWLQSQSSDKALVKPTFDRIEEIINGKLPESAYKNRSWWANDSVGHVQSKQWLDVGWRVASVNMTIQVVRFARIKERQKAYIDFYGALINELKKKPGFDYLRNLPDGSNWYWTKGISVKDRGLASFTFSFGRGNTFRVELYIDSGDGTLNKNIYDGLAAQKEEIEAEAGAELSWQRLNDRRASRIARIFKGHITDSEEELADLRQKAIPAMINYVKIMQPRVEVVAKELV